MKHHIYYHMDADGHASAGIIQEYLERTHGKSVQIIFQPINYGMDPYVNLLQSKDSVYMVDFSLQPAETMKRFVEICFDKGCSFTWIDHHKTAIEEASKHSLLKVLPGIRAEGRAGCELTWDYFNKDRPENPIIKLVADWDMWRRDAENWETTVSYLQTYLRFIRSDPKHNKKLWPEILSPAAGSTEKFLQDVGQKGQLLTQYQEQLEDSRMRGFARTGKFAGHPALIINSPQMNSRPFERMIQANSMSVELMVAWVLNKQGQFSVSLYSVNKGIDVGALCKQLGEEGPYKSGGGHPGAAGFQTDWEHLSKLMVF